MKYHEALAKLTLELNQLGLSRTEINDWVKSITDAAGLYRLCDWSVEFPQVEQPTQSPIQLVPVLMKVNNSVPGALRREHKRIKPIGYEEFICVINAIEDSVSRLIVKTSWNTGKRLREIVALRINDVDLDNCTIRFSPCKIVVPISLELQQDLEDYRSKVRSQTRPADPFFTLPTGPVPVKHVIGHLNKAMRKLGFIESGSQSQTTNYLQ